MYPQNVVVMNLCLYFPTITFALYFRLHEKHPWYSEQLTFLLVNTDNNRYLTKDEFFEAAKVSPDMQALNFSYKQLENLVDGLIAIGDQVYNSVSNFCFSTLSKFQLISAIPYNFLKEYFIYYRTVIIESHLKNM